MMKNIRAKKSLGQNFLKSKKALSAIILAGKISAADTVLEIGPGKGALTEKILGSAGKVIAIEKDRELISFLQEKFSTEIENKKLELIEGDILEFDLEKLFKNKKYKLIANIPYYITGAIFRFFLESTFQPETMVVLVQKEVAQRIVANPQTLRQAQGKESILSISVKAFGEPKYIMKVPAKDFSPAPKVDSAVLLIQNISKEKLQNIQEETFFTVVKAGFSQKRKKLSNNLEKLFPEKEILTAIFSKNNISKDVRAEDISLEDWINISKEYLRKK